MSSTPLPLSALDAEAAHANRLAQSGQVQAAVAIFESLLARQPDYSRALAFFASRALQSGQLDQALDWITRACEGTPRLALCEALRGQVLDARGDAQAALSAYESALEMDPAFMPAQLDAGMLLLRLGRPREANLHFRACLDKFPSGAPVPAAMAGRLEAARDSLAREQEELERALRESLATLGPGSDGSDDGRFQECLDIFLGRRKPMPQKPGMMYFPKVPALTFYPREFFPWLEALERQTDAIREELAGVIASQDGRFVPYVQKDDGQAGPGSIWAALNHKTDWGVYFIYNQGERVAAHAQACPRTTAILDGLPLVSIPGRGPTAFFSRLRPGTHIPAHHGATNTRLIVHLPLVVPPGCRFRVGNDVREWVPGKAFVFDDTIEHEAFNEGTQDRVVLIFDVWNPFLTERERAQVTAVTAALANFYPGQQHAL